MLVSISPPPGCNMPLLFNISVTSEEYKQLMHSWGKVLKDLSIHQSHLLSLILHVPLVLFDNYSYEINVCLT